MARGLYWNNLPNIPSSSAVVTMECAPPRRLNQKNEPRNRNGSLFWALYFKQMEGFTQFASVRPALPEVPTMGKRQGTANEAAWRDAKKLCRLSGSQVAMARALGMNPKKLSGLRPSPQQRWKLPVGAFIEECYRKRFGGAPESDGSRRAKGRSRSDTDDALETAGEQMGQVEDLVCYLANLADDLQRWLEHGKIAPEVLTQVRREFREIADALDAGTCIPQTPEIPVPPAPRSTRSGVSGRSEHPFEDDEIPF